MALHCYPCTTRTLLILTLIQVIFVCGTGSIKAPVQLKQYTHTAIFLSPHYKEPIFGGSIIGRKFILSSVWGLNSSNNITVAVGCGPTWNSSTCRHYRIKHIIESPDDLELRSYRFAVAVLTEEIWYSRYVQPIQLGSEPVPDGSPLILIGISNKTIIWKNISAAGRETQSNCNDCFPKAWKDNPKLFCTVPRSTVDYESFGHSVLQNGRLVGMGYRGGFNCLMDFVVRTETSHDFIYGVLKEYANGGMDNNW